MKTRANSTGDKSYSYDDLLIEKSSMGAKMW